MGPAETHRTIQLRPAVAMPAPLAASGLPATLASAAPPSAASQQAKLHRVAKQFEAMFMTEMVHQMHPKPQSTGMFRAGIGESAMQPFMDQALGDAVASRGGSGLTPAIERALNAAAAAAKGGK